MDTKSPFDAMTRVADVIADTVLASPRWALSVAAGAALSRCVAVDSLPGFSRVLAHTYLCLHPVAAIRSIGVLVVEAMDELYPTDEYDGVRAIEEVFTAALSDMGIPRPSREDVEYCARGLRQRLILAMLVGTR